MCVRVVRYVNARVRFNEETKYMWCCVTTHRRFARCEFVCFGPRLRDVRRVDVVIVRQHMDIPMEMIPLKIQFWNRHGAMTKMMNYSETQFSSCVAVRVATSIAPTRCCPKPCEFDSKLDGCAAFAM